MHRIDGPGATPGNLFTEGDPVGGVEATTVTDDWLNDVQEELMSVLTAGGIAPVKGTQNQVLAALRLIAPVVKVQPFLASGTYTPDPKMKFCQTRMVAGGGGGAGCTGGAGGSSTGGGGGSGGYIEKLFTAAQIGASKAVTIGAAGTPGNAAGNGGSGGNTVLAGLLTANGGVGGTAGVSGAAIALSGSGGAGGAATGGDVNVPGEQGGVGFIMGSTNGGLSGFGGGNVFCGRAPQSGPVGAGVAPSGRGGGGSGGACTSVSQVGGAGTAGFMVIIEYCTL